jgi:hypothetical protein
MARALAARSGALADAGVRAAAREELPQQVSAHAALLEALAGTGREVFGPDVSFIGTLARSAPAATALFADWLGSSARHDPPQ